MKKLISIIGAVILLCIVFKIVSLFFGATIGVLGVIAFVYFYPSIRKIFT